KCETDFVARSDRFLEFAKNVAMQIAAANPVCLAPADVPPDLLAKEREIYKHQAMAEGKPEQIAEKIVEGRIKKFYKEVCLLEQPFIKDDKVSIQDLMNELVGVIGENIQIGRFVRFALGEDAQ
ncbi:MAG: translation elongation factor Ts, partial [Desulfovibrio sp.]|nr:translation elongation factor Ts [Desulfovibrio sp.]